MIISAEDRCSLSYKWHNTEIYTEMSLFSFVLLMSHLAFSTHFQYNSQIFNVFQCQNCIEKTLMMMMTRQTYFYVSIIRSNDEGIVLVLSGQTMNLRGISCRKATSSHKNLR